MALGAPFDRCIECDDVINNPLCSYCLASQMNVVIGECDRTLARKVAGVVVEGKTKCISCGRMMGLCAHCFSKDIYEYLQEKNIVIAKEFLRRFDFGLRQEFAPRLF